VSLATFVVIGFALTAALWFVFFLLKLVLWMVFFPIRLLFKLLWLPIGLGFGALGSTFGLAAVPILLVVGGGVLVFGLIVAAIALLLPIAPFVLFGLLLWAMFRGRAAAA
jgi:hypothetical protein